MPTCCRKATSSSPRSCRERKKAPDQERKARRNRIMGPFYTTQSTGRRFLQVADFAKQSDFDDTQVDKLASCSYWSRHRIGRLSWVDYVMVVPLLLLPFWHIF